MLRQITTTLMLLFAVFVITTEGNAEMADSFLAWLGEGIEELRSLIDASIGSPAVEAAA
jgi:hypothetical protein